MLDNLRRVREPLAAVVLVIVGVNMVLRLISEALRIKSEGAADAMQAAGGVSLGLVSVLCVLLTVGLCCLVEPVTRHARAIAATGAVIVLLGTVIALVNLVGGLLAPSYTATAILEGIGGGTDIALKLVAAAVLWLFARRTSSDAMAAPASPPAAGVDTEPEPRAQPTWGRDAAAGSSWRSARDAAGGAQPATWGNADRGWKPATGQDPASAESGAAPSQGQHQAPASPPVWGAPGDQSTGPAAKPDRSLWNPRT